MPEEPRDADPVTATPFSKVYSAPVASFSAGGGWPSNRHRSRKCFREAARSDNSARDHSLMDCPGMSGVDIVWIFAVERASDEEARLQSGA